MDYRAMTVNERLYVSGLMKDFDDAVNRKDSKKVIEILKKVQLGDKNISDILDTIGLKNDITNSNFP